MRAGKLSHRVVLQAAVDVQSETGAPETSWSTIATVYASIEPLAAREALLGGGLISEADTKITIRFAAALTESLTAKSRVLHLASGRLPTIYNIAGPVEPNLARGTIELRCKSGANDG